MKNEIRTFEKKNLKSIQDYLQGQEQNYISSLKDYLIDILETKKGLTNTRYRVTIVKILLSLIPETKKELIRILNSKKTKLDYELHFTIFCYLDQIRFLEKANNFSSKIPKLVEQYLMKSRSKTANAAWMAGDLLGAHWGGKQSLITLKNIIVNARYRTGREAAYYGLYQLYRNENSKAALKLIRDGASAKFKKADKIYAQNILKSLTVKSGI